MSPAAQGPPQPASAPGVAGTTATGPQLRLTLNPPNRVFQIESDASMPKIEAVCEVLGVTAPAGLIYEWDVTLVLNPAGVPFAMGRTTKHPPIHTQAANPRFVIPFTAVRGGTLTVRVTASINGQRITATQTAEVLGVNPTSGQLRAAGVPELLLKLMMAESSLRQFLRNGSKAGYPVFSQDGLGGVGLGQITPRPNLPTDDEVWNWKANVKSALRLYAEKRQTAKTYLHSYPHSSEFQTLVKTYNWLRKMNALAGSQSQAVPVLTPFQPSLPPAQISWPSTPPSATVPPLVAPPQPQQTPLTVTLPTYTDEMWENETIRLYNGEPVSLHEYIAREDNGVLFVKVAEDGVSGTAEWHQVTAAERIDTYKTRGLPTRKWGDPDYVNDVKRQIVP